MERPNIFTYDDYRKYLKDWFTWMKEVKSGFSFRAFSLWAGFKSPNQLLLVMKGERNIALASLGKYFEVLKLKQGERKYFQLLVEFNQAKDMAAKAHYFRELSAHWLKHDSYLAPEQYRYLSNWYYTAIRELVNLKDFVESGQWIARRLGGLITPVEAKRAIQVLLELRLLARDQQGRLVQTAKYLTTGDEVREVAAFLYHEQMMKLAADSLRNKTSQERNLTALSFTIKRSDYEMIVGEITDFRKRVIAALQQRREQDKDEELYQLNIHLFPVTRQ